MNRDGASVREHARGVLGVVVAWGEHGECEVQKKDLDAGGMNKAFELEAILALAVNDEKAVADELEAVAGGIG